MDADSERLAGEWISSDGRMRVKLNRDGTFDEVRAGSARAFHGFWEYEGSRVRFRDPTTGYEAVGHVRDGVLYADGCEFIRA
jgi:hypothetical protein